MIQLDNRVRESLSFVSEANVPQKPIIIQMRRWNFLKILRVFDFLY